MSNLVWKVESAWDEFDNCPGQVLFFHKKENAQKCLREWLTVETKIWEREGLDPTRTRWPDCKTFLKCLNRELRGACAPLFFLSCAILGGLRRI